MAKISSEVFLLRAQFFVSGYVDSKKLASTGLSPNLGTVRVLLMCSQSPHWESGTDL